MYNVGKVRILFKLIACIFLYVLMLGITACGSKHIVLPELEDGTFVSGDIFREYKWSGPYVNAKTWLRVTDPMAEHGGAMEFLPNPVNSKRIDDLEGAIKAEVYLEIWGGHPGTSDKKMRINGNEWITVPESTNIGPGAPESYMQFRYPVISIPLDQLIVGENTFEFSSGGQISHNFGWGQWGVYGVIFRVYYTPEKPHIVATDIVSSVKKTSQGESVQLDIKFSEGIDEVKKVEYIGYYEDFDYNGDGIYKDWQYNTLYGDFKNNIGTSKKKPFSVEWDTSWIPDQDEPIYIRARITDKNNITYITPVFEKLTLVRPDTSVKMYKPYDVPENWTSRNYKEHNNKVDVGDDLSKVIDAKVVLVTWNGYQCTYLIMNGNIIAPVENVFMVGKLHDYRYDEVPVDTDNLIQGVNIIKTYSETQEHGIEVMWPGIVLKVRYNLD